MAAKAGERVRLDLNSPEFQEVFFHLEAEELKQVVASLRLSQKVRAIAYREGDFLRFVSLHPDRDSAYRGRAVQRTRPPGGP